MLSRWIWGLLQLGAHSPGALGLSSVLERLRPILLAYSCSQGANVASAGTLVCPQEGTCLTAPGSRILCDLGGRGSMFLENGTPSSQSCASPCLLILFRKSLNSDSLVVGFVNSSSKACPNLMKG